MEQQALAVRQRGRLEGFGGLIIPFVNVRLAILSHNACAVNHECPTGDTVAKCLAGGAVTR